MDLKEPSYGTAKALLQLITLLMWGLFSIGIFAALFSFSKLDIMRYAPMEFWTPFSAGVSIMLTSLFVIAGIQISRAIIDNAIFSWHILQTLQKAQNTPSKERIEPKIQV